MIRSGGAAAAGGGLSLASVLGVVFIVLKLAGVIEWSWWWVVSPWWISAALSVAAVGVVGGCIAIGVYLEYRSDKKRIKRMRRRS